MAMEPPRTEWRFLARKITNIHGPFSQPCLMKPEGKLTVFAIEDDIFVLDDPWAHGYLIYLLRMVMFCGDVSLPEGTTLPFNPTIEQPRRPEPAPLRSIPETMEATGHPRPQLQRTSRWLTLHLG